MSRIEDNFKDILEDIANGSSVLKACKARKVGKQSFFDHLEKSKENQDQYTRATYRRGESAIDRIEEALDNLDKENSDPAKLRIKIDTLKWFACKFYPKVYGDKLKVDSDIVISFEDRIKQLRSKLDE